jgi:uncharacterized protein GlcG (DUF336 family)
VHKIIAGYKSLSTTISINSIQESVMKKLPVLAGLLAGSLIAAPASIQAEEAMVLPIKRLSMDTAVKMAQATIKKCRSLSYNVAVTVVDRGGHAQVMLRDTLAPDITLKISRDKAYTAMSFNAATVTLKGRLFESAGSIGKMDGVVAIQGGLPINVGGTILGGIGVSGASSKVDEDCAKAGLDAVLADLEMSM